MPVPIALVVVVVTRVWSLAVDGLFLLTAAVPTWFAHRRSGDGAGSTEVEPAPGH
jgi:hypothetical protein